MGPFPASPPSRCRTGLRPLIFTLVLLLPLPARSGDASADPMPVKAGAEKGYPPFSIVTPEGQADGLAVELLAAALQAVGRKVEYTTGSWSMVKQSLAAGRLEALPLVSRSPERDAIFDFTFPYLTLHGTIVTRKDAPAETIEQLAGKTVAVMRMDTAHEFLLQSEVPMHIVTTDTFEEALQQLNDGMHDAVVIQRLLALNLMRKSELDNLTLSRRPLNGLRQDFCFAVHEGDKERLALLNEGLALVVADGTLSRLQAKWLAPIMRSQEARPYIIVGGDDSSPPYEYLDKDGRPAGFIVSLTRAIGAEMGVDVVVQLRPFSETRAALEAGSVDVVQGMFYSEERARWYRFSPSYEHAHYSAFGWEDGPGIDDLEQLKGKRIAVMRGDLMQDFVQERKLTDQLILTSTQEDAMRLLYERQCDYALVMTMPGHYYRSKNRWLGLDSRSAPLLSSEYCYAATQGNAALIATFADGLNALKASGEYRELYDRHLGVYEPVTTGWRDVLRAVGFVLVPLLLLLLGSLLWSRSLSEQIRAKTRSLQAEVGRRERIAERLRQSEERLVLAQRFSHIGTWDWDFETGLIVWSDEVYRVFRISREEFNGSFTAFEAMLHPDDRARVVNEVQTSIETGTDYDSEFRIITPSTGQLVWIAALGRAAANEQGTPVRMLGVVLNIDERMAAQEAIREREQFFRAMFMENHAVMILVDAASQRIEDANAAACAFYGYPRDVLCTMRVSDLNDLPGEDLRTQIVDALERERNIFHFRHRLASGKVRDVVVYSSPVMLGQQEKLVSIVHDVTEGLTAQRELEQRTRDLTKANEDLQQFAYVSSHDLQEPLRSISGFLQLLQRRYAETLNAEGQAYIQRAVDASRRLQQLIESLLEFSRIGTRGNEFADVDLNQLFGLVRENLDHQIRKAGAVLHVGELPKLHGDASQLTVLFQNLLSNAVKFRAGDRRPEIHVQAEPAGPGQVRIDVVDNGIGIASEYYERIFKIFQRLHTRSEYIGNGMGLAICQRIATRHGGRIELESTPGQGTTFRVFLPAAPDEGEA